MSLADHSANAEERDCPIFFKQDGTSRLDIPVQLPSGHTLRAVCIKEWRIEDPNCPMSRTIPSPKTPEEESIQERSIWNLNRELLIIEGEDIEDRPIWDLNRELVVRERRAWTTFDCLVLLIRFIIIHRDPEEEDPLGKFRRETAENYPGLEDAILDAVVRGLGSFAFLLIQLLFLSVGVRID